MATTATVTISITSSVSGALNAVDSSVMSTIVGLVANTIEEANIPVAASTSLSYNLNNVPLTVSWTVTSS